MDEIAKARCISDAQIQFVSLVDKAANKRSFLIAKAEDGKADFSTYGKIVKTDTDSHYVTGVVYEPMAEDSQGDFMTEEEIRKAARWFNKNGSGIDIQHSFEKSEKTQVIESWIAPSDFEIGREKIKKGSWLMTVEITDPAIWSAVEKGEITGFSMGGKGVYSEEDIDLGSLSKSEGRGFFKKLAKMLGFEVVEKDAFADRYSQKNKITSFWDAFYSLQEILFRYDPGTGKDEFESDSEKIKECLAEFSEIVQSILADGNAVVEKADKTLSVQNTAKLRSAYESIGDLLSQAEEKEENMTKSETTELIKQMIAELKKADNAPPEEELNEATKKFIVTTIKQILSESKGEESVTKEDVVEMVKKAMEPLYQARGIANNLNDEPEPVSKSDDIFDGMFM